MDRIGGVSQTNAVIMRQHNYPEDGFLSLSIKDEPIYKERLGILFTRGVMLSPKYLKTEVISSPAHALHPLFKGWTAESIDWLFELWYKEKKKNTIDSLDELSELAFLVRKSLSGDQKTFSNEVFQKYCINQKLPINDLSVYWEKYLGLSAAHKENRLTSEFIKEYIELANSEYVRRVNYQMVFYNAEKIGFNRGYIPKSFGWAAEIIKNYLPQISYDQTKGFHYKTETVAYVPVQNVSPQLDPAYQGMRAKFSSLKLNIPSTVKFNLLSLFNTRQDQDIQKVFDRNTGTCYVIIHPTVFIGWKGVEHYACRIEGDLLKIDQPGKFPDDFDLNNQRYVDINKLGSNDLLKDFCLDYYELIRKLVLAP